MTTETATARVIRSTWQNADIDDTDYAAQITDAIDREARYAARKSTAGSDSDSEDYSLAYVVEYADPETGGNRWAFHYSDGSGAEYIDYPDRALAEAAYEEQVRGMQGCVDGVPDPATGDPQCWWDITDVPDLVSVEVVDQRKEAAISAAVDAYRAADSRRTAAEEALSQARKDRALALAEVVKACDGDQSKAGRRVELDQSTVNKLLKRFDLA
jgi:hypothetical protein